MSFKEFKDQYGYNSNQWYQFENHRWIKMSERKQQEVLANLAESDLSKAKDELWIKQFDTNPNLVCFKNGVYDLTSGRLRKGTPNDYISKSTGIDYVDYHPYNKHMMEITNYLFQLFTDNETVKYMLIMLGGTLDGYHTTDLFHIWLGNKKDMGRFIEFFQSSVGDYTYTTDIFDLDNQDKTPSMDLLENTEHSIFSNLDHSKKLNVPLVKDIVSGNWGVYFKAPAGGPADLNTMIRFRKCAKPIICSTQMPVLPKDDVGCWMRLRIVTFEPSEIIPCKEWKSTFVSMLLHYHQNYKDYELKPTKSMCATFNNF